MYSKQEAAQLRQQFWTVFGQYMAPQLSASGERTHWINYKTGIRNIRFTMEAGRQDAEIAILIDHADAGIRALYFEQFEQLKNMLRMETGEAWTWEAEHTDAYGKQSARIVQQINGVSIFHKEDWPALISFFKPRIMALDAFWQIAKDIFDALQ